MKVTTTVSQVIETEFIPFEDFTMASLRQWRDRYIQNLRDIYGPVAVNVELHIFCNADQRDAASKFAGFVPACDFRDGNASRRDFGACESFRFLWKH